MYGVKSWNKQLFVLIRNVFPWRFYRFKVLAGLQGKCTDRISSCRFMPSRWGRAGWWLVPTLHPVATSPAEVWTIFAPSIVWKREKEMFASAGNFPAIQVIWAAADLSTIARLLPVPVIWPGKWYAMNISVWRDVLTFISIAPCGILKPVNNRHLLMAILEMLWAYLLLQTCVLSFPVHATHPPEWVYLRKFSCESA